MSLQQLHINQQGFAFNPVNGASFSLNPMASSCCRVCGGSRRPQLAEMVGREFGITVDQAQRDLDAFCLVLGIWACSRRRPVA